MPTGACLCGATSISYTAAPLVQVVCHCRLCRAVTGTGGAADVCVPRGSVAVESRAGKELKRYAHRMAEERDAEVVVTVAFCPECGTCVMKEGEGGGLEKVTILPVGILDPATFDSFAPKLSIYTQSRAGWVPVHPGCEQLEGGPKMS